MRYPSFQLHSEEELHRICHETVCSLHKELSAGEFVARAILTTLLLLVWAAIVMEGV